MEPDLNICEMIHLGGVYKNIEGTTSKEIYDSISKKINLPSGITPQILSEELYKREAVLSTAVGNGIAIPHAQHSLLKNFTDQRVAVCYLKEPIEMKAPDNRCVYVMFVLLTSSVQSHLQMLSRLARLFQKSEFKKALEAHVDEPELLTEIRKLNS